MEQKYSPVENYFAKKRKFFGDDDSNAKKAFSCLKVLQ